MAADTWGALLAMMQAEAAQAAQAAMATEPLFPATATLSWLAQVVALKAIALQEEPAGTQHSRLQFLLLAAALEAQQRAAALEAQFLVLERGLAALLEETVAVSVAVAKVALLEAAVEGIILAAQVMSAAMQHLHMVVAAVVVMLARWGEQQAAAPAQQMAEELSQQGHLTLVENMVVVVVVAIGTTLGPAAALALEPLVLLCLNGVEGFNA